MVIPMERSDQDAESVLTIRHNTGFTTSLNVSGETTMRRSYRPLPNTMPPVVMNLGLTPVETPVGEQQVWRAGIRGSGVEKGLRPDRLRRHAGF
jgi:hypothetical protein